MNKKYITFAVLLFSVSYNYGQQLKEPIDFFNTILQSRNEINSYYVGGNPAYLKYESSLEELYINSGYYNETGDFKKFTTPKTDRLYEISFSGKKSIDSQQVFRGSFGVQKVEYRDRDIMFSKNADSWNPFMMGDSVPGTSRFNGIIMKAEYGASLFNKYLLGVSFNYNVDDGLKKVFPHPVSDHRYIDARLGIGYLLNENLTFGGVACLSDHMEHIDYSTDQGYTTETILYKFRGYANPLLINKKEEARYSYDNNYSGYFTLSYKNNSMVSGALYFGGGIEQTSTKDDDNNPYSQGYFENTYYKGGVNAAVYPVSNLLIGLYYDFEINNMWARSPAYNVREMENSYPEHIVKIGAEYTASEKLHFGVEAGVDYADYDYKDYYSQIYWKARPVKTSIGAGAEYKICANFSALLTADYAHNSSSDNSYINNLQPGTSVNDLMRKNDILYYQSNYNQIAVSVVPSYYINSFGLIKLYVTYINNKPQNDIWPDGVKRETIDADLEFRLNVF